MKRPCAPKSQKRQTEPRPGTKLRRVFDLLATGEIVSAGAISEITGIKARPNQVITRLADNYGLNIRRIGYGQYKMEGWS